jgi:hypothetical protein
MNNPLDRHGFTHVEDVATAVIDQLRIHGPYTDRAAPFHNQVMEVLDRCGWSCESEYQLEPEPLSGRRGKIDIVATKDKIVLAIECDRRTPRRKSIAKLTRMNADVSMVLLRGMAASAPCGVWYQGEIGIVPLQVTK